MLNLQSEYRLTLQAKINSTRLQFDDVLSAILADDIEMSIMTLRHVISQLSSLGDDLDYYRYVTYKENQNGNDRSNNI